MIDIPEKIIGLSFDYLNNLGLSTENEKVFDNDIGLDGKDELIKKLTAEDQLILSVRCNDDYPRRRLFRPTFRYFSNNYANINYPNEKSEKYSCILKKPLPSREQFIKEVLEQKDNLGKYWVKDFLEANLV